MLTLDVKRQEELNKSDYKTAVKGDVEKPRVVHWRLRRRSQASPPRL